MSNTTTAPMPLRRVQPTTRGLQLQPSVLDAWRAQHGPEQQRAQRQRGLAQAGVPGTGWGAARSYAGAQWGRTTADWVTLSTSADAELYTSLRNLRNRTRQLVRDNEHAKHAQRIIRNNVVGHRGIGLQSEVLTRAGKLNERVNDRIEAAWARWCRADSCHVAGKLSLTAIQQMVMGEVPTAGEILVRLVRKAFGRSRVPLALELIEADQLVETLSGRGPNGNQIRMGVEVDDWLRPVAYWLYPRHPGDVMLQGQPQSNEYQRVPADEILHIATFDRPSQTRGVPWFHAALTKLRHIVGTEEAEIVRARASAAVMGFIQSPETDDPSNPESGDADGVMDGEQVWDLSPGVMRKLAPGETFSGFAPNQSNAALDPFLRYMLRSVAAGIGLSYESLSRDYSQSNYSSSRMALLDDRDHWRALQVWLCEVLLQPVFERWLDMAVLAGELPLPGYETSPELYQAVRWMPRGWDWVDPAKEVAAAKAAVRAGFVTVADVVAAKGGDWEDVFKQRARERQLAEDLELVLESDPAQTNDKGAVQTSAPPADGTQPAGTQPGAAGGTEPDADDDANTES